jgi:hypothetical protein
MTSLAEIKLKGEEFLCHEDTLEENKDGTITVEGRILIYTNKGSYNKVVKVRLDKEVSQ